MGLWSRLMQESRAWTQHSRSSKFWATGEMNSNWWGIYYKTKNASVCSWPCSECSQLHVTGSVRVLRRLVSRAVNCDCESTVSREIERWTFTVQLTGYKCNLTNTNNQLDLDNQLTMFIYVSDFNILSAPTISTDCASMSNPRISCSWAVLVCNTIL